MDGYIYFFNKQKQGGLFNKTTVYGKTFVVRVQNGHSRENFCSCMLVIHIDIAIDSIPYVGYTIYDIADWQGHVTPTCWHFCICN